MKIIHLSDLHFGTEEDKVVQSLKAAIQNIAPDLVIVSGDFTQIGNTAEFQMAADFIQTLPCPVFSIPGNHDVSRFNLWQRFTRPFKKYREYINTNLDPVYETDQLLVAGVNSARRALPHWNWANGAVGQAQRDRLKKIFSPEETRWTLCTLHHPIHKFENMPLDVTVFGGKKTMQLIQNLKIDLVLTGHVHHASISTFGDDHHKTVFLSASTALSSRLRDHENGFNLITLDDISMQVDVYSLTDNAGFKIGSTYRQDRYGSST